MPWLGGPLPAVAGVYERAEPCHIVWAVVHGPQVHAEARAGIACQVCARGGCMRAMQSLWGQACCSARCRWTQTAPVPSQATSAGLLHCWLVSACLLVTAQA